MTVTEFAILHLSTPPQEGKLPAAFLERLTTAKQVLDKASGYNFHFFQQVEDPSLVYIIGRWESVAAHGVFLPSDENKRLLDLLKDDIDIPSIILYHLETDVYDISEEADKKQVFEAPTISCNRHFVPAAKKEGFIKTFQEVKGLLQDFTNPFKVIGSWRIEKESEDKEEWVLFSGFNSVEHHYEFPKTEEFAKYREIVNFVDGFEVKHLKSIPGF
ncbi:hypothetical protein F5884DRAFT_680955 [Xylogone sp. PMI_703]|nr:hypothetical protein F5884DRAFT_680955 [Xylogone sp. PMI_703]